MNRPGRAVPMPSMPLPVLPPAVVVHGWEDACDALRPGLPVALLSAPSAALFAGIGWWRSLVDGVAQDAGASLPGALADILDCEDSAGLAVQALRNGCKCVVLHKDLPAWADVAARAEDVGAALLPARPPALDLRLPAAHRGLLDWLRGNA